MIILAVSALQVLIRLVPFTAVHDALISEHYRQESI